MIIAKSKLSKEKTRAGQIKEHLALAIEENKILKNQDEKLITRNEVIEELKQKNLLTNEEIEALQY